MNVPDQLQLLSPLCRARCYDYPGVPISYSPNPRVQKMIDAQMKKGGYSSTDDLFIAALAALDDATSPHDFAPGELDALLAEGDADIERGDVLDGEQALEDRRRRRAEQAKRVG